MRYFEIIFNISTPKELLDDVCDVVAAMAGETGFESFEQTAEGLTGYVQQQLFDEAALKSMLSELMFPDTKITYNVREAENRNWNEQWEQEGFDPVLVGEQLIIHDGRHLPHSTAGKLMVEIDTHMAFGTGNHATTRMMAGALMTMSLEGSRVLDCGTGTGVLAIVALLRGAASAIGYDIDEWSADNARHNAVINGVEQCFTSILGDSTVIDSLDEQAFDVVMANINRNILLEDMPRMRKAMKPTGTLLMSGFYQEDIPMLTARAEELGLTLATERNEGQWAMTEFKVKH